ncbi:MAG TPA: glycosyltransferase family 4 protein [Pirellulales bacterium]|jgi:glycosyltransferase involved in cell wall biosynthesis|nr:glycosyltransferase family 4 protein [Pirellulales bacterium]
MRILHVINSLDGPTARQLTRLLAELRPPEWTFEIFVAQTRGNVHLAGLPPETTVRMATRGRGLDLSYWRQLGLAIDRGRPDLVQAWDDESALYAGQLAASRNIPLVAQHPADVRAGWLARLAREKWGAATACWVASSPALREQAIRAGRPAARVVCIRPGVAALETATTATVARADFLREFGLPDNARCAAIISPLQLRNRVKDLIWATDMLKFYGSPVQVLVFGDGPQRWRMEKFSRQCEVADRLHFLGNRADILRWLPFCDLLWDASEPADSGAALAEAMGAGIPLVASDTRPHRDWVRAGENGLLVPVGARAEFANAANRLFTDRALAEKLGAAGRSRALAEFSAATMAAKFAELYRSVLARGVEKPAAAASLRSRSS